MPVDFTWHSTKFDVSMNIFANRLNRYTLPYLSDIYTLNPLLSSPGCTCKYFESTDGQPPSRDFSSFVKKLLKVDPRQRYLWEGKGTSTEWHYCCVWGERGGGELQSGRLGQ